MLVCIKYCCKVLYGLGAFFDIRIDSTMDCSSFHMINMLRLQHGVSLFSQRQMSLTLARGATDAARNEQASGMTRVSVECTARLPPVRVFCLEEVRVSPRSFQPKLILEKSVNQ
jgi:hypothetical protein